MLGNITTNNQSNITNTTNIAQSWSELISDSGVPSLRRMSAWDGPLERQDPLASGEVLRSNSESAWEWIEWFEWIMNGSWMDHEWIMNGSWYSQPFLIIFSYILIQHVAMASASAFRAISLPCAPTMVTGSRYASAGGWASAKHGWF